MKNYRTLRTYTARDLQHLLWHFRHNLDPNTRAPKRDDSKAKVFSAADVARLHKNSQRRKRT